MGIDFSRQFIPEPLTPLYHTAAYRRLTDEQRLRYNQLHALYLNEQTIFFESAMARHILQSFLSQPLPPGLHKGLQTFIAEESRHSEMFRQLNRSCRPDLYTKTDFYFVHIPAWSAIALQHWVRQAHRFPFFLWILLIQEERASFYAKEFLNAADALEPHFVETQRKHLADEIGHIGWDEELLDWKWPRTGKRWRKLNARLFAWMMGEYFTTPKRSGLRVVFELLKEYPGLQPVWRDLRHEMLQLSNNREFHRSCYSRTITPKTFARFDRSPEFHPMNKVLAGYEPR